MDHLQEKFQILTPPSTAEKEEGWVTLPTKAIAPSDKRNQPPPGMDISNTDPDPANNMPLSLAGRTDVSGEFTSEASLKRGFTKLEMKGCDDQYTGEHVDLFYGDAGGFVERNNYLDRE